MITKELLDQAIKDAKDTQEWVIKAKQEIERLTAERDMMAEALEQVMTWIDNWSPEFTYDADWPADRDKALAALAKIKKVGA